MKIQSPQDLKDVLQSQIALAIPMGCEVNYVDETSVELFAPLDRNWNHIGTGFGGSQFALAMLASWSVVLLFLSKYGLETEFEGVVRESQAKFRRPARSDLKALCSWPKELKAIDVLNELQSKKRAQLNLRAEVLSEDKTTLVTNSEFVLLEWQKN